MNKVAAVIVTYNRKKLLEKCIQKLNEQTEPVDILIIDNASTDGTREMFEDKENNLYYYNTGSNLGGAGGFCYGIHKAVEKGYQYLWILDDDTMATSAALENFIKSDKELNGEYGFLSSKVLWKDGSLCLMNIQKKTKWKRLKNFDKNQRIQYASFVSLFLRADTVREVGLPYSEFFIWADDWEYTRRISKKRSSYFISDSVVEHWCATNVGADIISVDAERSDRFNYMYRNDVVLYRQDGLDGKIYLLVRNLFHIFKILMKSDEKMKKINIIRKATKEGKSFYPEIQYPEVDNENT